MRLNQEDVGKRVLLTVNPDILKPTSDEGVYEVPYTSLRNYQFLLKVKPSSTPKIVDTSKAMPKVDPLKVGRELGVSEMTFSGEITQVKEDYFLVCTYS